MKSQIKSPLKKEQQEAKRLQKTAEQLEKKQRREEKKQKRDIEEQMKKRITDEKLKMQVPQDSNLLIHLKEKLPSQKT